MRSDSAAQAGVAVAAGDLGEADGAVGPGEPPGGQVGDEAVGERGRPPGGDLAELGRWCRRVGGGVGTGAHGSPRVGAGAGGGNGYRLGDTQGGMECASRTT